MNTISQERPELVYILSTMFSQRGTAFVKLGPLLFLLYINDITNSTQNLEFVLYADDTTLFYSQPDISNLKENIESELSKVTTWFKINRLLVNFDKTHFVPFHNRSSNISNALENFIITIDSHTLNKCNSVNFLGIHIDGYLPMEYSY